MGVFTVGSLDQAIAPGATQGATKRARHRMMAMPGIRAVFTLFDDIAGTSSLVSGCFWQDISFWNQRLRFGAHSIHACCAANLRLKSR